jgi:CheY-like chemotaxis protein
MPKPVVLLPQDPSQVSGKLPIIAHDRDDWAAGGVSAAALRLVRDDHLDVIFLDQNMPQTSGLQCLAKIRQPKPGVTPIVMTSSSDESLAADARVRPFSSEGWKTGLRPGAPQYPRATAARS